MKIVRYVLGIVLLLAISLQSAIAAPPFRIVQHGKDHLMQVTALKTGHHKLEIDDAWGFRTPVVTVDFSGSRAELHPSALGLIAGLDYHARLDGKPIGDLRLPVSKFVEPEVSCKTLRRTWEQTGRLMAGVAFSGVQWDGPSKRWVLRPRDYMIGHSIYSAELYLRPALDSARACNDTATLDEVAQYYILMLQQTETVGSLLKRRNVAQFTRERMAMVDQSARTFVAPFGDQVGDGELYNVQWLHPASRLLRLISLFRPEKRTSAMTDFAALYTRFIVTDQLKRYLVEQRLLALGGGPPVARIELWKTAMRGLKGRDPWDTAMSDIDLWLLAAAAEVLGANANDPALVSLTPDQAAMLRSALETGVRFFQSKRSEYPETSNFQGQRVGSASYFNGDYAAHSDYDFSAITSEKFPSGERKKTLPNASWDISHAYRIPIFLRSLYENRKATGVQFPQYHDLQLVVNQYVYRVFGGDFSRPLFHNYFDGSDGWHRVGFNGPAFGYPPSVYCDMHNSNRPCLVPGNIIAWGQLAFVNDDLVRLEKALVSLAFSQDQQSRQFRDRYYFYSSPFETSGTAGQQIYGNALYFLIAENAEMIADRPENMASTAPN